MEGGLDLLKPKTQVKNWFCVQLDSRNPAPFSQTSDSILLHQPPAIITSLL